MFIHQVQDLTLQCRHHLLQQHNMAHNHNTSSIPPACPFPLSFCRQMISEKESPSKWDCKCRQGVALEKGPRQTHKGRNIPADR